MARACTIIHEAVGRPNPRRDTYSAEGRCYWCAAPIAGTACKVGDVITDSFTDQDQALARSSPWLCVACSWAMTGRPPDTLRLWSIAYREDGAAWPANHPSCTLPPGRVHAQNKADPTAFRALLREPPAGRWVCSIADSGQIHTLPFAPVNAGADRYGVRFERVTIWTSAIQYSEIDDAVTRLLAAGYTKLDIASEPFPGRLLACGIDIWRAEEPILAPWRGSELLDLVLFLARSRKDTDAPGQKTEARPRGSHRAVDDEQREQRANPPHRVVEPSPVSAQDGGTEHGQLRFFHLENGEQAGDRRDDHRVGTGDRRPRKRARR